MSLADRLRKSIVARPKVEWVRRPEILLNENIPLPLHGIAPRVVLGAKWWEATRQAAYRSTSFHCVACGIWKGVAEYRQWLEGHEVYQIDYQRGRAVYIETVPLCHLCHNFIHDGRLQALLEQGKIQQAKYAAILQHGHRVLTAVGLRRPTHAERENVITDLIVKGDVASWDKWRLVIDGVEYPPLYQTFDDWKKAFKVT